MSLLRQRERPIIKEQLERLYCDERLSMAEIAQELDCSINKVVYWMEHHQIPRRNRDEANYIKHNPNGDPFRIKEIETAEDRELFQLGIGLYIGEGSKEKHRVLLANTDPDVIRAFLRFLREICGVDEKRIYAWLNIFDDVDLEEASNYWKQVTGLSESQFFKPTIRTSKGGSYRNKSRYGTLTVGLSSTKLSSKIQEWCQATLRRFS
jgi:hypothetical protein